MSSERFACGGTFTTLCRAAFSKEHFEFEFEAKLFGTTTKIGFRKWNIDKTQSTSAGRPGSTEDFSRRDKVPLAASGERHLTNSTSLPAWNNIFIGWPSQPVFPWDVV